MIPPAAGILLIVAISVLALIEWWLAYKMSPPPAQMGKIYQALIIDGTMSAVTSA